MRIYYLPASSSEEFSKAFPGKGRKLGNLIVCMVGVVVVRVQGAVNPCSSRNRAEPELRGVLRELLMLITHSSVVAVRSTYL